MRSACSCSCLRATWVELPCETTPLLSQCRVMVELKVEGGMCVRMAACMRRRGPSEPRSSPR